ncbi:GGDEF domain-containing protein [Ideonella sp.]|uniref:GGDEF domain-containing protein n=1 Tax=Ideonella sp. TaxID=1929293 RepID=UPI003BB5BFDC
MRPRRRVLPPDQTIDLLADLIDLADRDALESRLIKSVCLLVQPATVALARVLGDREPRWLVTAQADETGRITTADPLLADLRDLPALADRPDWAECFARAQVQARVNPEAASITLFPVSGPEEVLGVLVLQTDRPLTPAVRRLVLSLLTVFRKFQALLRYSECDLLTGLLNRKSFEESFYKASALPLASSGSPGTERRHDFARQYWLALIDIDHFKQVNDRFGHLIGDEVLLLLSRVMRQCFRHADQLYRFGGEEFVVLLRCANEADAMAALQRLRVATSTFSFPQVERITISVGFTDVRLGDTPNAAVERADKAVYHAKHHGRDQVCSHRVLLSSGAIEDEARPGDVELF